ncbi:MAG: hypothetical protein GWN87_17495, partial [Desulfuromonadales bacterium]|nr:hypothetical protein [Desulfuromonadales bacterium]
MTTQVTQCPKCQTSFRVTEAQLKIAGGAVRCGSCLHIFHAPDHWLSATPASAHEETPSAPEPAPDTPETPAPDSAETESTAEESADHHHRPGALRSLDDEPEP